MRITSLKYLLLDHLGLTLEVFVLLRQDQEAEVRKKDMTGWRQNLPEAGWGKRQRKARDKTEHPLVLSLPLWCWRKLLRIPWTSRRSNQSILKEINPEHAEAPTLGSPDARSWLIWKDPDAGKDWRQEKRGMAEDKMVGWHQQLSGHEFEQSLGDGIG